MRREAAIVGDCIQNLSAGFIEIIEKRKDRNIMEIISIQMSSPMLYDRLYTLSAEYDISVDLLISLAVKRLLDDVEFIRDLRNGKVQPE